MHVEYHLFKKRWARTVIMSYELLIYGGKSSSRCIGICSSYGKIKKNAVCIPAWSVHMWWTIICVFRFMFCVCLFLDLFISATHVFIDMAIKMTIQLRPCSLPVPIRVNNSCLGKPAYDLSRDGVLLFRGAAWNSALDEPHLKIKSNNFVYCFALFFARNHVT